MRISLFSATALLAVVNLSEARVLQHRQSNITSTGNSTTSNGSNSSVINIDDNPVGALNTAAWAIIYTYPLAIFANVVGGILRTNTVNTLANQLYLASPDVTGVIKPNVDVLYSRIAVDLSAGDLVLTIPSVPSNRYAVWPLYDPYGNVIVELGTVNNSTAGDYLIHLDRTGTAPFGLVNVTNSTSPYKGIINTYSVYNTGLVRFAVLTNSTEDIDQIHALQNVTRLQVVPRNGTTNTTSLPSLTSVTNGSFLGIASPAQQLAFAAQIVQYAPPPVSAERSRVYSNIAAAGVQNGTFVASNSVNYTAAAAIANASILADISAPSHQRPQGNNWTLPIPSYQGYFGTHYASAAYVALYGYQQQTVKQTLYPGYNSLGYTTIFNLPANTSVLVTFSGKPPVLYPGFWSLSVYGSDQQLVRNSLYRFKVGSASNQLVYRNGRSIYGANASVSDNGPFDILIQPANLPPPANWTSNWLPGDVTFSWLLRWYIGSDNITNGAYVYPQVRQIPAILA